MAQDRKIEVPIDYDPRVIVGEGPSAQTARGTMTALHGAWMTIRDAAADQTVSCPGSPRRRSPRWSGR